MKKFFSDFKAFVAKGNVIDMAVGVVIGGAFGKIVTSLVNDIIMPLIAIITGSEKSLTELKYVIKEAVMEGETEITPALTLNYGNFIQLIIDFLLVAFCIFCILRTMMKVNAKLHAKELAEAEAKKAEEEAKKKAEAEAEANKETVEDILRDIRESLKK